MLPWFSTSTGLRVRVDTSGGYASYSIHDLDKAISHFSSGGGALRICKDIHDDGFIIAKIPLVRKKGQLWN